ncbi:MAG: NAD(P)H-dependent oxidoreductase [Methanocorpusculum sp.]|nr:NAD(P)H-dependent oxidoreductase [Methanocorpusculum sp.]MDD4132318.1 NAD(P)H-dependent oxidoreductase [Methanocorpusculum sp.]
MKILAVVGSLRTGSFNRQLASEAAKMLPQGVVMEIVDGGNLPLFNEDLEYPPPEAVTRLREKVKSADGIWFFTPEYNHFFPGNLKNLIDWLSRPVSPTEGQVLQGKPAAISGASPGISGTGIAQDHLIVILSYLDMKIMNQPRLIIPNVLNQVDAGGKLVLKESLPYLQKIVNSFVRFIIG